MSKTFILIIIAVILLGGILYLGGENTETINPENEEEVVIKVDPRNATYVVEDREIKFVNGQSEIEVAPGSAIKMETSIFGEPIYGDLDADGDNDAALIIIQYPGGTGTFYYVAAAVNTNESYVGTNAIYLGDRIAPQTVEIKNGELIANYADRKPTEPFSAEPTIGKSLYAKLQNNQLIELNN